MKSEPNLNHLIPPSPKSAVAGVAPDGDRAPLSRRATVLLITSLMMGMALAALDATIIGTALPTIVADLGGIDLYSWLIAAYLLTSTTTVPLYGRVADIWGRKPVFLLGIVLFLVGSGLCGLAQSMVQLVIFRGIQGLGAGAIQPMVMTILGDVFQLEQRARMQGFFSAVWGISSVVGLALGSIIVTLASWHWIFYVNFPFGIIALVLISKSYHERVSAKQRSVDILGAALLVTGVSVLLLALQNGVPGIPISLLYIFVLLALGLFLLVESRTADPIVPLGMLRRPILGVSYLISILMGTVQFGVTGFVPLFVQGAMGGTALAVGAVIAPMSIGWPLGSIASGRLILRFGYKIVLIGGVSAAFLGSAALQTLSPDSPHAMVMGVVALIGLGMGLSSTPVIIAVQNAVQWDQRGTATALTQFSRTIGGSIGVALMGGNVKPAVAAPPRGDRHCRRWQYQHPSQRTSGPRTAAGLFRGDAGSCTQWYGRCFAQRIPSSAYCSPAWPIARVLCISVR
ncbi:MAG: MFS transporter [Dehalococcoidia bacterium]|nr:MFS transporter [Dehalococcoidia bacterium]